MLTQCYLGELYKRGSLPVPAQLLPRPEAIPGRPGAGGHFTGQEDGWSGADGHFPGQGGGWQGENRSGGGGRVSGGPGCNGRGTEVDGRAGYEGNEREAIGNDARLDSGTAARIAKAARWLTGDHRPGLLLYGTVGSGKSTLARAIC